MEAMDVVDKMKQMFEPKEPLVRKISITISDQGKKIIEWGGCEVRKTTADGKRSLLLLTEPAPVDGLALLFYEPADKLENKAWIYPPTLKRTRQIKNVMAYESFLNSDFTFADLGFFDPAARHELQADHKEKSDDVYVLKTVPQKDYYYSKIITLVSAKNFMPLKRHYYDKNGDLWKTLMMSAAAFDAKGRLVALKMKMTDLFENTSTTYHILSSDIGADIPDAHLQAETLSALKTMSVCPK